jgi:hypothetical protein
VTPASRRSKSLTTSRAQSSKLGLICVPAGACPVRLTPPSLIEQPRYPTLPCEPVLSSDGRPRSYTALAGTVSIAGGPLLSPVAAPVGARVRAIPCWTDGSIVHMTAG